MVYLLLASLCDQPENARQITRAGMGLWVDINTVSEDELHTSISRVLSEPRYIIQKNMNLKRLMHVCEHFIYESSRYVSSVKATKTNYQRELSKLFQIKLPYAAAKIVMGVQTDKK